MAVKKHKKRKALSTDQLKKKYDFVVVYVCDGGWFTFRLNEWSMYQDYDWLELTKLDGTEIECFFVANVARISFGKDVKKQPVTDVLVLKPA